MPVLLSFHTLIFVLLNGLPPIMGFTLFQITFINFIAIYFEYYYLAKRYQIKFLLVRVILANICSLTIGIIVMYSIADSMPGNIYALGGAPHFTVTMKDRLTLFVALFVSLLVNIALEIPPYLIKNPTNSKRELVKHIFIANLITNIPVVLVYFLLGFSS